MAKNTTVYYHLHQDVKVQEKRKKKKEEVLYKVQNLMDVFVGL